MVLVPLGVLWSLTSMGNRENRMETEKESSPGFQALSLHLLDRTVGKVVQLSEPVTFSSNVKR